MTNTLGHHSDAGMAVEGGETHLPQPAYLHTERWEWEVMQCYSLRVRFPEAPADIRSYDQWTAWMENTR